MHCVIQNLEQLSGAETNMWLLDTCDRYGETFDGHRRDPSSKPAFERGQAGAHFRAQRALSARCSAISLAFACSS